MKKTIVGFFLIAITILSIAYAFSPHTEFTHMNGECWYFYGDGQCRVFDDHCNTDGSKNFMLLERNDCLIPNTYAPEPISMFVPEAKTGEIKEVKIKETIFPVIGRPAPVEANYLEYFLPWFLFLFALLVIWLIYMQKLKSDKSVKSYRKRLKSEKGQTEGVLHAYAAEKRKRPRYVCPRDGMPMKKSGKLKQGPRGGLRQTYICTKCGYHSMRSLKK